MTDLSYVRTLPGKVVGYGMFVLESAGQDQALREVSWIPDPDHTYRAICAEIFGAPDDDTPPPAEDRTGGPTAEPDDGEDGGWAEAWLTPEADEPPAWAPSRPRTPSPVVDYPERRDHDDHSRAMPLAPPLRLDPSYDASHELYEPWEADPTGAGDPYAEPYAAPDADGESLYVSDDIARRQRAHDTGPLPRYDD